MRTERPHLSSVVRARPLLWEKGGCVLCEKRVQGAPGKRATWQVTTAGRHRWNAYGQDPAGVDMSGKAVAILSRTRGQNRLIEGCSILSETL